MKKVSVSTNPTDHILNSRPQTFSCLHRKLFVWVVTKTRNGMEPNGTEHSVIFRLFAKIFQFRVRDPEIEVFGASRRRVRKRTEWNGPLRSTPFRVLVTTFVCTHAHIVHSTRTCSGDRNVVHMHA